MEPIIFASFYIFSFIIFLLGVFKNSWVFCMSGSLLLMIFSSVTIVLGIQHTETDVLYLNVTNPDESVDTYKIDTISFSGLNDPYTFSFTLIIGVFSAFFFLYSLLYLRNKLPVS